MFVDEIKLHLKAGKGGDGVVRWRHEKGKEYGGPSGGNGGKGGDVYALAVRDIGVLANYRNTPEFAAGNGQDGAKELRQGAEGEDIELKLPMGSRVTNVDTGYSIELLHEGDKVPLLRGGRGGLGNAHFKSSVNIRPKESTPGEDGEEADFYIELLLVVDIGLIGLPNAGKSSLLNALTSAKSKVGSYPFTTLEPSLGSFYGLILADIPGLIEGAAEGRGLGHKFLRHIERTRALVHCVSSEAKDPLKDHKIVRRELRHYNEDLPDGLGQAGIAKKPEIVVLTKADLIPEREREEKLVALRSVAEDAFALSILDDQSVKEFGDFLTKRFK